MIEILILIIITISYTYSYVINSINPLNPLNHDFLKYYVNSDFNNVSDECKNDLNLSIEFSECSPYHLKIYFSNYKEICSTVNSEKCQNFYKDPFSYLPNCKNDSTVINKFSPVAVETAKVGINYYCTTNDDGEICPAPEATLKGLSIRGNKNIISNTCKSRQCIKGLTDYLNNALNNINELEEKSVTSTSRKTLESYKSILEELKSKNCISLIKDATKILNKSFIEC
ncbi:hypothetical protein BCR32DRAFT_272030 [Anaeromyces robustus]|uniref:Uncharacterized protein n=1 Tax=Anaeromyces robustus TaxID=1754192 RepID=A0A1Y1WPP5_9FUNG|nr:hypothetical protein BCR32DRAFT_272030 [Anaeromyces robustus]|eukprot:ORX75236.1 hypothetical protein BCR32DRAFT_272030 [Anaeromyces robustus]